MNLSARQLISRVALFAAMSTQAVAGTGGADLSITVTDGLTESPVGNPITYTITISNAGPANVMGALVNDTFPAELTGVSWTCTPQAGSACTAAGMGDISDSADILAGSFVTYSATGTPDPSFTGTLSHTASVTPPGGVTDPNNANNSATDDTTIIGGLPEPIPVLGPFGAVLLPLILALFGISALRRRQN